MNEVVRLRAQSVVGTRRHRYQQHSPAEGHTAASGKHGAVTAVRAQNSAGEPGVKNGEAGRSQPSSSPTAQNSSRPEI